MFRKRQQKQADDIYQLEGSQVLCIGNSVPPHRYFGGYSSSSPPTTSPSQPPPPSPQDSQIFRSWFINQLSTLVENNRAVIHRLAYIAREHIHRFAPIISQCLEAHIRRVHSVIKLPAWYLLDSISKNLGVPYTQLFSSFVAPLFLECYDLVDDSTRSKMEEMLVTWRTGGPGGVELFGQTVQLTIERAIWGDMSSGLSGPTPNQVLIELDVILAQKTRAVDQNPADTESKSHIEVLQQLRSMVQATTMSTADLNAIITRLRDLAKNTASAAPALPAMPPPPSALSALISQPPAVAPVISPPAQTAMPHVPDVSQLFQSLVAAGLISGDGSAVPSGASQSQDDSPKIEPIVEPKRVSVDSKLAAMREYENQLLSLHVSLSASGLQRPQPTLVSMMYEDLPLKCKQCARRFADNELGRKARDDHLDFHFRQNKRASQALGRGHCRSWFVGTEDWIHDITENAPLFDAKGKGRANPPPMSAKAIAAAVAEREANLRKMHVIVPPGEESKVVKCPICKEQLDTQFLEDDEEWVWRNAITLKGKVYHATCHADALSSQTAARLRDQTNRGTPLSRSRSRSGTPEPSTGVKIGGSPLRRDRTISPPPVSTSASITTGGTKRKSPSRDENEKNDIDGNGERSPINLTDGGANVKTEPSDDNGQSQPSKRLRTSPPPPPLAQSVPSSP